MEYISIVPERIGVIMDQFDAENTQQPNNAQPVPVDSACADWAKFRDLFPESVREYVTPVYVLVAIVVLFILVS